MTTNEMKKPILTVYKLISDGRDMGVYFKSKREAEAYIKKYIASFRKVMIVKD